jgi:RNA methyltransferase, TrmH family
MIRDIAGRQNNSVKLARKLQKKKHRRERGLLVGEGMDLLRAALQGGADVQEILVRRELLSELPPDVRESAAAPETPGRASKPGRALKPGGGGEPLGGGALDIGVCDQETLDYASSLGGSADVVFICAQPVHHLGALDLGHDLLFYLDCVGDPGNVGTLVRTAAAFGLGGVICSPGTADPYGPKALRGGMGAQFSLPVVAEVEVAHLYARLDSLAGRGETTPEILVADPRAGSDVRSVSPAAGAIVVLGSERSGPGGPWDRAQRVTIPQRQFDSLNVAMAGTILAYELSRTRALEAGDPPARSGGK